MVPVFNRSVCMNIAQKAIMLIFTVFLLLDPFYVYSLKVSALPFTSISSSSSSSSSLETSYVSPHQYVPHSHYKAINFQKTIHCRFLTNTATNSISDLSTVHITSVTRAVHLPFERGCSRIFATRDPPVSVSRVDPTDNTDNSNVFKEDLKRSLSWFLAALSFSGFLSATKGVDSAVEFASGYVLEQSLSVDNLFVFLVLFDYFKVPNNKQERVLKYGLGVAVLLRGIFIGLGYVALEKFHNILLLFAAILLFSSYKILLAGDEEPEEDMSQNAVVQFAKKFLKTSDQFDGDRFFTIENGASVATPLFLCLLCVEFSDVIFALDSVPAVFGVTEDPLIVFSSNIFAIASLRSVYGILSRAVEQLQYLEKAVGVVLGVIAVKMASETVGVELLSPLQSLVVVLSILATGVVASLATVPKGELDSVNDPNAIE